MNSQLTVVAQPVRAKMYSVLAMVTNDDCNLSDVIVTMATLSFSSTCGYDIVTLSYGLLQGPLLYAGRNNGTELEWHWQRKLLKVRGAVC